MSEKTILIAKSGDRCIWLNEAEHGVYVMHGGCSRFTEDFTIDYFEGVESRKLKKVLEYCIKFGMEMEEKKNTSAKVVEMKARY